MLKLNRFKQIIVHSLLVATLISITACSQSMSEQQILDKAKTYLDKGETKSATIELRNVLQKNNKNAEAHFLLGNINLKIGNFTTAKNEFNRAALAGWDQQQTQLALARIFITTKNFQKLLDEIIDQDNWSSETRANITALRAIAEAGLNKPQRAKAALEQAANYKTNAYQVLKATVMFQFDGLLDGDPTQTLKQALLLYPNDSKLLLLQASNEIQNKKLGIAADIYRKIINNETSNLITTSTHIAHIRLARLQMTENKPNEAMATLAPLLERDNNDAEANYLSGQISFVQGNYNHAEDYIRNLLTIIPDHAQSQYLMGKIKFALKNFKQASHHLANYLKTESNNQYARILLTQSYINLHQSKLALSTLQPLLTHRPDEAITLSLLSQIAFMNGDLNEGIRALKKAIQSAPDNAELQKQLVKAYIATGKTRLALKELKKLSNNTKEIQKLTISAYLRASKIKQAIEMANTMLQGNPKDPEIIALNGTLHAANNDPQQARNYFNKALQLQKNLPSATNGLARLERKQGHLDNAITLYTKLVESGKGGAAPMIALSELAEQQQRPNDMLSWLEKARTAAPTNIKPRIILANYYLHKSQPGKANIYIQEALKISPEYPELLLLHGRALLSQKHYSRALLPLKKLLQKHPDAINAQLLIGEAYLRLGKTTEARQHLQLVIQTQPDHLFATILIAETEFVAGNHNRSLTYAKKLQHIQAGHFSGYSLEGDVWLTKENYPKARSAYTKAWQLQQSASLAKKLFFASKHIAAFEEAIDPIQSWLNQHADDNAMRLFLAAIYQNEKQNDNVIREYEKIIKLAPNDSTALNNLAWFYSLKNSPKALDLAERAYHSAPENAGIQDTYGWILTQQDQPEKGLRLIKLAMQTLPDNPDVRFHFATALIKSGDYIQGSQILKELLDQNKVFEGRKQAKQLLQNTLETLSSIETESTTSK